MPKKPESKLWKALRDGTAGLGVHWVRMESWASPGVPDVNGCLNGNDFWVELKVLTTKSDKKFPKWRPHQIVWQTSRTRVGGCVWNLVHHPSSGCLLFLDGTYLAQRLMDGDPVYDDRMDWPMDKDGWAEVLRRLTKSDDERRRETRAEIIRRQSVTS